MSANAPLQLPHPKRRNVRGGSELCSIVVDLEVVTPILGGGAVTRKLDDVDIIRVPTVRGHLRFWWRALRGHEFESRESLYKKEGELWGGAADEDGGRSLVDVRIRMIKRGQIDDSDIRLYDSRDGKATEGAYALWTAKSERRSGRPPSPRLQPGTRFQLELVAPKAREDELRNVVRGWVLFGGYGSRTRRGLGSVTVTSEPKMWLPARPTREELERLFGRDIFAPPNCTARDTPWLAGAALRAGERERDAQKAWTTALDWLKEFRQGCGGNSGDRAREPGAGKPQSNRPSISNWPEADKIRHLTGKTSEHEPHHNPTPAWPRAGFGLPIVGQFQHEGRNREFLDEPGDFELRWRTGGGSGEEHGRLASPLIVKALPLCDGRFVPCALWLTRGLPPRAAVVLARQKPGGRPEEKEVDPRSAAPFDLLVAPGDTPQFSALKGKTTLRDAFLDWLYTAHSTTVVAP